MLEASALAWIWICSERGCAPPASRRWRRGRDPKSQNPPTYRDYSTLNPMSPKPYGP